MTTRRLLGALAAAAALSLAVTASAGAIPIINFKVSDNGSRTTFSATLVSPPKAASCTAIAQARMFAFDRGAPRVMKALGRHRINVCQDGSRGTTPGSLTGFFSTTSLRRPARYAICIRADQRMRSGKLNRHTSCKPVYLR